MAFYSDAELTELRLIDRLVRAELKRRGLPLHTDKTIDELIASGELKAAECHVRSKDMVTPGWLEHGAGDQTHTS